METSCGSRKGTSFQEMVKAPLLQNQSQTLILLMLSLRRNKGMPKWWCHGDFTQHGHLIQRAKRIFLLFISSDVLSHYYYYYYFFHVCVNFVSCNFEVLIMSVCIPFFLQGIPQPLVLTENLYIDDRQPFETITITFSNVQQGKKKTCYRFRKILANFLASWDCLCLPFVC